MPRRSSTLLIFAVAAVARFVIAFLQLIHGIQNMNWLQLISWSDFYQIYGNQLASLSHGLLPYLNFGYWYTPLFLYTLYLFYLFGGIHLASVPMLLADTAMAPLIYLIVLMRSNERVATIAGLLYALFPVALFVEGYLWLSSEPMAFPRNT
ncbi:MAG: hypothetical protein M1587_03695 [Thaumarchaeota archaeon]|nr:hypothetical protein [Nitrososphaerota archaeon]